MACTTCTVCFISTVSSRIKKRKKKPWKPSPSSRYITNLKQSIFVFRYLWVCQTAKSDLSSTLKCDQNYIFDNDEFGHVQSYIWAWAFVQQTKIWGWFVEQKLVLSCSFGRDQIHHYWRYDFGHTSLCYLSQTQIFNKPTHIF